MTLYNRYLLTLTFLFGLTSTILAAYNQSKLDAYLTVYVVEYLIATLLFIYINPKARRLLDALGYILFGGVLAIVIARVIEILKGA